MYAEDQAADARPPLHALIERLQKQSMAVAERAALLDERLRIVLEPPGPEPDGPNVVAVPKPMPPAPAMAELEEVLARLARTEQHLTTLMARLVV